MHYVPYLEGRFHTASPDSQGVPSGAILQFLTELDRLDVDLHSLYIFRNGFQLLGANRRPYQGDTPRRIYSAAKALTGLAVLFAIQEGLVSLKTRLTQLFPEDLPETVTPRMESITVYHLLTMTTRHDRDTFRPVLNSTNSVRAFLEEPLDFEPGTHFLYNNGVPHILGLIVKKVSGINYLDFLRPRFLEPLGIYCTVEQTQRGELEGSRTMCTAEGFAKLSLFYLQEGNWNGQQLLDARLVRAAVSFQVPTRRCSSISFMHSDQLAGYGFQLWRNAREGARLDGGRSQFGFLFPDKEMAIVCNAIEEDSGLIPAVLWDTLYSAIQPQAVPTMENPPVSSPICPIGPALRAQRHSPAFWTTTTAASMCWRRTPGICAPSLCPCGRDSPIFPWKRIRNPVLFRSVSMGIGSPMMPFFPCPWKTNG